MPTRHHFVILSGGMDSFTLLHTVRLVIIPRLSQTYPESNNVLRAVSFNYGQRHLRELRSAARICADHLIPHKIIDLRVLRDLSPYSALTGAEPVPHGHYAAENMKKTVVAGRNMTMLSLAAAYAESSLLEDDTATVYYGAHSGDHTIYPDCRPTFILPMMQAVSASSNGRVSMRAPFMDTDKIGILRRGLSFGLNYADTWSCYEGGEKPCGKCGACVERAEAFAANNVADPALGTWHASPVPSEERPEEGAHD